MGRQAEAGTKITANHWTLEGEIISLWQTSGGYEVRSPFWKECIPVGGLYRAWQVYYENLAQFYGRKANGASPEEDGHAPPE